ncbi:MAG: hypothetical protein JXB00_04005 [Bacteroidales bacterium]|nr:hypothetical protein [Bacteroidales bacterium]
MVCHISPRPYKTSITKSSSALASRPIFSCPSPAKSVKIKNPGDYQDYRVEDGTYRL